MGMGIERVLRELLGKHALTYVEISREIHSSAEDVSAWSRGLRKPRRTPVRKLRRLLHRENERERSRLRSARPAAISVSTFGDDLARINKLLYSRLTIS